MLDAFANIFGISNIFFSELHAKLTSFTSKLAAIVYNYCVSSKHAEHNKKEVANFIYANPNELRNDTCRSTRITRQFNPFSLLGKPR